jgi:hypothetical protein
MKVLKTVWALLLWLFGPAVPPAPRGVRSVKWSVSMEEKKLIGTFSLEPPAGDTKSSVVEVLRTDGTSVAIGLETPNQPTVSIEASENEELRIRVVDYDQFSNRNDPDFQVFTAPDLSAPLPRGVAEVSWSVKEQSTTTAV